MNNNIFPNVDDTFIDKYWIDKIKRVVQISKEYGFSELDAEFWISQKAIILTLIDDLYKDMEG